MIYMYYAIPAIGIVFGIYSAVKSVKKPTKPEPTITVNVTNNYNIIIVEVTKEE